MKTPLEIATEHARAYVRNRGWRVEPLNWEEAELLLDEMLLDELDAILVGGVVTAAHLPPIPTMSIEAARVHLCSAPMDAKTWRAVSTLLDYVTDLEAAVDDAKKLLDAAQAGADAGRARKAEEMLRQSLELLEKLRRKP